MCVAAGIWLVVEKKSVRAETRRRHSDARPAECEELKDALSILRKRG